MKRTESGVYKVTTLADLLDDGDTASQRADELARNIQSIDDLRQIRLLRAMANDCRSRALDLDYRIRAERQAS